MLCLPYVHVCLFVHVKGQVTQKGRRELRLNNVVRQLRVYLTTLQLNANGIYA